MTLQGWLKQNGEQGGWSQRQPLEPFPTFRHRSVAAGWEHIERYSLHQLRRGLAVPARIHWFRTIDAGWEEPTGMIHLIVPDPGRHPEAHSFLLGYSDDPAEHCRQLEEHYPYSLQVYQQWPGSRGLANALDEALSGLRERGAWLRWEQEELMQLTTALDVITNAWAHRRYWFGLDKI